MAKTAESLNEMLDSELEAHVKGVLLHLVDPSSAGQPEAKARFVTAEVLRRLHVCVVNARKQGLGAQGWSKQATLARVVGCFTGVSVAQGEAEYIGNLQDRFVREYEVSVRKAKQADHKAKVRAIRAGRTEVPTNESRLWELQHQLYRCKYGGVPRNALVPDASSRVRNNFPPPDSQTASTLSRSSRCV